MPRPSLHALRTFVGLAVVLVAGYAIGRWLFGLVG